jgi:hypothetical protein
LYSPAATEPLLALAGVSGGVWDFPSSDGGIIDTIVVAFVVMRGYEIKPGTGEFKVERIIWVPSRRTEGTLNDPSGQEIQEPIRHASTLCEHGRFLKHRSSGIKGTLLEVSHNIYIYK